MSADRGEPTDAPTAGISPAPSRVVIGPLMSLRAADLLAVNARFPLANDPLARAGMTALGPITSYARFGGSVASPRAADMNSRELICRIMTVTIDTRDTPAGRGKANDSAETNTVRRWIMLWRRVASARGFEPPLPP